MNQKKNSMNIIEACMRYRAITFTIAFMLVAVGIYSLITMPRSENPVFTIRQALVYAAYPGADELQVEREVTEEIEEFLFSFEEVKKEKTISTTSNGEVFINVELNDWVKDSDRFWATLQNGLNNLKAQSLPQNVMGPVVNSNFGKTVAMIMSVSSPERSFKELSHFMDQIEDKIKVNQKVSRITRSGMLNEEVKVLVDDQKLSQYKVDFNQVAQVLQNQNQTTGGGDVRLTGSNVPVLGNNQFTDMQEVSNQIIQYGENGQMVRLKDIANIQQTYEDTTQLITMEDQPVLLLSIEMQNGHNMTQFGKEIEQILEKAREELPADVNVKTIVNQPEVVSESIQHFLLEFAIAIGAVILVVILLLPFRMALISAIACPLSIMATFAVSNLIGLELHQVSLAGLIIVLGMVVDDAIVVVDNYIERLDHGVSPWEAAWKSATQLFVPVLTATVSIIFAFAPLAWLLEGRQQEFVLSLPTIIGIALFSSFIVSMLIVPSAAYLTIKQGLHQKEQPEKQKKSILDRVQEKYDLAVEWAFGHDKMIIGTGVFSVLLGLFIMAQVEQEFMPDAERNQFNIELWLPPGTPYQETRQAVAKVENAISGDDRIIQVASFIGTSSPRFYSTYAPENPRENYAQIFITTTGNKTTEVLVEEYIDKFDHFLPEGHVRVRPLSFLNAKAPIELRVVGQDMDDLIMVGDTLETMLDQIEGTSWVRNDFDDDYLAIGLQVQQDKARQLNLTNSAINRTIAGGLQGMPVSTFYQGEDPIDIVLQYAEPYRENFDKLLNVHVTNSQGNKIQLSEVAEFEPEWHYGNVIHQNGLRTLTVRSEALHGRVAADIMTDLKPKVEQLDLPAGISIEYGGEDEQSSDNLPGLALSLLTSMVLIFFTLLIQFKSLKKTMIILCTFPLSLLGASLGLFITGNPFSFTAFMGIISLIGIVVRNGIILVDFADEMLEAEDLSIREAAIHAAKRRMRPIFLTTAAAAVGVTPMIVGGSPLWAPLGSVLAFGLIISMFFTLFIIPILYYKWLKSA